MCSGFSYPYWYHFTNFTVCFSANTVLVCVIVMMSCGQLSEAGEGRSFSPLNSVPSCATVCSLQLFPYEGVEFNFFEWFCWFSYDINSSYLVVLLVVV